MENLKEYSPDFNENRKDVNGIQENKEDINENYKIDLYDRYITEIEVERDIENFKMHKPWGYCVLVYTNTVKDDIKYQIKKLIIKPGGMLSLQRHLNRSEHWTVISGKAEITLDIDTFYIKPDDHVFIPAGVVHRINNSFDEDLIIIEVQYGTSIDETDIVRVDDIYGRC